MKGFITKIISRLSGEFNLVKFWNLREKIIKKNNKLMLPIYYLKYQKVLTKCGAGIPINTEFKNMPTFPHSLYGIFISTGAKIGANCVIFHQVTIGSNTLPSSKKQGAPIIGDNCFIGVGAKIIGGVKIGDNVRIGANCVVTEDVPDNCTVVLNKPRIIEKKNVNNEWIPFK